MKKLLISVLFLIGSAFAQSVGGTPPGGSGSVSPTTMFFPVGGFGSTANNGLTQANQIQLSGFYLPNSVVVNNLIVQVSVGDGANNYDWGIYDSSGSLKVHTGAHTQAGTGVVDLAVSGAPITLSAGKYYFAITGNATTIRIFLNFGNVSTKTATFCAASTESVTTSSGGALPASATMPADSWTIASANIHGFVIH